MTKVPMNYSKCCIYKIEHNDDDTLVYVGHTTNFEKRKIQHKSNCKNDNVKHYNSKVYQMIRENGGWNAFKMLEVEKYPCADKREAERRENEVMKELKASMNMINSFVTKEELKEYKKEHNTNYYKLHKEKIQEREKKYYEQNKPKKQEYNKEYYESNKQKILHQMKESYETKNVKVKCECGCEIVKSKLKQHQARKKHLEKMKIYR